MTIEEARNWLIQGVERQIPQKPIMGGYTATCYNCKHYIPCVVRDGKMKYCPFCGQAID